jgi:hypothetical protein
MDRTGPSPIAGNPDSPGEVRRVAQELVIEIITRRSEAGIPNRLRQ